MNEEIRNYLEVNSRFFHVVGKQIKIINDDSDSIRKTHKYLADSLKKILPYQQSLRSDVKEFSEWADANLESYFTLTGAMSFGGLIEIALGSENDLIMVRLQYSSSNDSLGTNFMKTRRRV